MFPSPKIPTTLAAFIISGLTLLSCDPLAVSNPDIISTDQKSLPLVQGVRVTTIVRGLEHPWGMAWLPNGELLLTERPGRLRIVRNGRLDPRALDGVAPVLTAKADQLFASQQGGLLDIALHPQFRDNQLVYLTYSHGTRQANRTRVARATFDGQSLQNWEVIFEVDQAKSGGQHFGSRLTWLPDNTLLVSIGDGGNPPLTLDGNLIRQQAQNLNSHLGKIIRLNDDGTIPTDNPFLNTENAAPAVWSLGHRNIQGLTYDPIHQRVWATEHGARGGDELNIPQAGKNYGWPTVSYSREYSTGRPVARQTSQPGFSDPQLVWIPSIAPSGLAFYTGERFPNWRGDLLAGGLVSQDIRRIRVDANGTVREEQRLPIGRRVRDIRQGPDGLLYVLTDAKAGELLRLSPATE